MKPVTEEPVIRDARRSDLAALLRVRSTPALLGEHLGQADGDGVRFMVYERDGRLLGFAMLFLRQPAHGKLKADMPRINDDPAVRDTATEIEELDIRLELAEAIRELPQREQLVLSLYYYEELTVREVADRGTT